MIVVNHDPRHTDRERREALYRGELFIYSPTDASLAFASHAEAMIREAFGSLDPETAQHSMDVQDMVDLLKDLKPAFIHDPKSKRYLEAMLEERGCDPQDVFYDVPRLRSSTSDDYLTAGIAYAWHPHRDTWYSAPSSQINWWFPVFPITGTNAMSFFPRYFGGGVPNDSAAYDYAEWNAKHRFAAAANVKTDDRPLPGPEQPIDDAGAITFVTPVGGSIVFSPAHLHASVPNTSGKTRWSVDFRELSLSDTRGSVGAPMDDVECTGSNIRDFKRLSDRSDVPEDVAAELEARV